MLDLVADARAEHDAERRPPEVVQEGEHREALLEQRRAQREQVRLGRRLRNASELVDGEVQVIDIINFLLGSLLTFEVSFRFLIVRMSFMFGTESKMQVD